MRIVIMPGFAELTVIVNPAGEVTREGQPMIIMPWLYAPWQYAKETGVAEIQVAGESLRALLNGLSAQYKRAKVDFDPFSPKTNDVDSDYDVLVNGKNYVALPRGLDAELRDGDEVKVKMVWRWDG